MKVQKGLRAQTIHRKYVLGAHPILEHFMDRLRIRETIGTYIAQDQRLTLSVEKTLTVLIHNILTHPMPMYELADWLEPLDETTLGLTQEEGPMLQDDRMGRALEAFYAGRHKDVFFRLALRAIKIFRLDCTQIHQDTTTVTFSGKYAGWTAREFMTYGINKDHRPDLKQLVLGISITADGAVPLVHEIYDGNQTDDRLHVPNHQRLRKLLGRSDFIYVADCKLATESNLGRIAACGGRFVSVMPRTWKEDAQFRDEVRQGKMKWRHLLSRPNNRKPDSQKDHYYVALGEQQTSQGYRLIWIRSTQKAEQDCDTRTRHLQTALEMLKTLQGKLNAYHLKTREKIEQKVRALLKEHQTLQWVHYQIHDISIVKIKYTGRGRPKKEHKGRPIKTSCFSLSFGLNKEALDQEALTDGIFPLIANLKESYDAKRILEIYKFQPFLEKRHSQIKTWQEVTPVLLKKSERVVALLHMHVMALMVATLIERTLRLAMKRQGLKDLPLYPEGKSCPYPTTSDLVRLFRGVEKYEVQQGETITLFPAQLNPLQKQALQLLEVPLALYQ